MFFKKKKVYSLSAEPTLHEVHTYKGIWKNGFMSNIASAAINCVLNLAGVQAKRGSKAHEVVDLRSQAQWIFVDSTSL